ncbi:MAG: rod-binding protein [Planctomycetes bacterium]|nr:rod-binding protein [Planctomycetota bacterium]
MRIDTQSAFPTQDPSAAALPVLDLAIPKTADGKTDNKAAAKKFEGLLLSTLVGQMRQSSGLQFFGESPGAQVFEGLFDQFFGESLAARGGIGLSKQIEESMKQIDEARDRASRLSDDAAPAADEVKLTKEAR